MAQKFTRKSLKKDSFVEHTAEISSFIQEHFLKIGVGLLALVVILVGTSFYNQGQERSRNTASYLLYQGQTLLSRGMYAAAQERLMECTDRFGGTESGKRARLDLAHALMAQGNHESALATIEEGLAGTKAGAPLRTSLTILKAAVLGDMNQHEGAANIYRELLARKLPDAERVDLTFRLVDCLQAAGKTAEAVKVLEDLQASYEQGDVTLVPREVENRLFMLKALAAS